MFIQNITIVCFYHDVIYEQHPQNCVNIQMISHKNNNAFRVSPHNTHKQGRKSQLFDESLMRPSE